MAHFFAALFLLLPFARRKLEGIYSATHGIHESVIMPWWKPTYVFLWICIHALPSSGGAARGTVGGDKDLLWDENAREKRERIPPEFWRW